MSCAAKSAEGLGLIPALLLHSWVRLEKALDVFGCQCPQLCKAMPTSQGSGRVNGSAPRLGHSQPGTQWVATGTIPFSSKPTL